MDSLPHQLTTLQDPLYVHRSPLPKCSAPNYLPWMYFLRPKLIVLYFKDKYDCQNGLQKTKWGQSWKDWVLKSLTTNFKENKVAPDPSQHCAKSKILVTFEQKFQGLLGRRPLLQSAAQTTILNRLTWFFDRIIQNCSQSLGQSFTKKQSCP